MSLPLVCAKTNKYNKVCKGIIKAQKDILS